MAEYKNIPERHKKDVINALETGNHEFLGRFSEYKHESKELVLPIAKKRIEQERKQLKLF